MSEFEFDNRIIEISLSSYKAGGRVRTGLDHDQNRHDDDEEDEDGGPKEAINKGKRRGYKSKAKLVALYPFTEAKKFVQNSNKKPSALKSISSSKAAGGDAVRGNSWFCLKQSLTSDADSITSDPNDPKFTFDMLRSLIEKNDFYSKECNTHLDVARRSHSPICYNSSG